MVEIMCSWIFVLLRSNSASVQLTLSTVNKHNPTVNLTHTRVDFMEGGSPVLLFPSILIVDDDDTCEQDMLRSATVKLNSNSSDFISEEVGLNEFVLRSYV